MRSIFAVAISIAFAGLASSQAVQYVIDPKSVDLAIRKNWCQSQKTQCPLLCLQLPGNSATTIRNDCDADALTYSCVCQNGVSPNATEYTQTLPFYICQEWQNQCVSACGQNNLCSNDCRANHPCGAQSPTRVNSSTISTMPATKTDGQSATSAADFAPLGAAETTSSEGGSFNKPNGASTVTAFGQNYGLAVVAVGIFSGFALLL